MIDDIVTRLRRYKRGPTLEAADTIERLRAELCTAWEQAERWRDERDEARREVCVLRPSVCLGEQTAHQYAANRGWACFKEDGK